MNDYLQINVTQKADTRFQDGGLPYVVGASCFQVLRATRNQEKFPATKGYTYNHAPMLSYFNGHFLLEYLSSPVSEHQTPSEVFLTHSPDGRHWETPQVIFPAIEVATNFYCGPKKELLTKASAPCVVHHRMGFYTAKNGKQLVLTFYGLSPDGHLAPNNGYGVGRCVREVYADFSLGPVYFLRYNPGSNYNASNTKNFPFYTTAGDKEFVVACKELLANKIVREQWREEEALAEDFFRLSGGKALSYYTLPTGRVMGVFKDALASYTDDQGSTWAPLAKQTTLETATGKVWGQKTPNDAFILVYNPSPDGAHRWPLALTRSLDGTNFGPLAAIVPEISPCRYQGKLKNLGAQYIRGISEANAQPDDAIWLTYSINKEDIWVCRLPRQLEFAATKPVVDHLQKMSLTSVLNCWNLYCPQWGQLEVSEEAGLRISEEDPYDRSRATRMIVPSQKMQLTCQLKVAAGLLNPASLTVEDDRGQKVLRILFYREGTKTKVTLNNIGFNHVLGSYLVTELLNLAITADCQKNVMTVLVNDAPLFKTSTGASVTKMCRVVFATKDEVTRQTLRDNGKLGNLGDLPHADEQISSSTLQIFSFSAESLD